MFPKYYQYIIQKVFLLQIGARVNVTTATTDKFRGTRQGVSRYENQIEKNGSIDST